MILDQILFEYDAQSKNYQLLEVKVKVLIEEILKNHNLRWHKIESRVKTREKLEEKVIRKSFKYASLNEVTDVVGFRIISLFDDEIDNIVNVLNKEFLVDHENSTDKRIYSEPDRFGYKSFHFIVSFPKERTKLTEYKTFEDIRFEIQVRSILQHAWAEIQHDLGYKDKDEVPQESVRDFSRIASLLELSDKEFIRVKGQIREYRKNLPSKLKMDLSQVEINKDSIVEFINGNKVVKEIEAVVAKKVGYSIHQYESADVDIRIAKYFKLKNLGEIEGKLKEHYDSIVKLIEKVLSQRPGFQSQNDKVFGSGVSVLYLGYLLSFNIGYQSILAFMNEAQIGTDETRDKFARMVHSSILSIKR